MGPHTHGLMEDLNKQRIRVSRQHDPAGETQLRFAFLVTKSRPPVPLWLTLDKFKTLCLEHSTYSEETAERTFKHSAGMLLAHEPERVRMWKPPLLKLCLLGCATIHCGWAGHVRCAARHHWQLFAYFFLTAWTILMCWPTSKSSFFSASCEVLAIFNFNP